jgi:hypothetical protein
MILPCKPMSELGGYGLWKMTAILNKNEMQNIARSSIFSLFFVGNHHHIRYDYTFPLKTIYCFPKEKPSNAY